MKKIINSRYTSLGVIFMSLVFMGFGIYREEYVIVFKKAIRICMECIGIG